MGHHYTPQAHLRRFQIETQPDSIWMYDKESGVCKPLPIPAVAQERGFYPAHIEKRLNELIEIPSHSCIGKLLRGEPPNEEERFKLARYMFTMMSRGPRRRRKNYECVGEVLPKVIEDIREELTALINEKAVDKLNQRLEEIYDRWSHKLPENIEQNLRTPYESERTLTAVHQMAWEIMPAAEGYYFLTSDTPVHYFEWLGIGREESEFTFTISKEVALIGHHQTQPRSVRFHKKGSANLTKEVNRRIISTTERFLFAHREDEWIKTLAQKPNLYLSSIRW